MDSGLISGTPDTAGTYNVIITATDAMDSTRSISTASFSIEITAGGGGSNPTWSMEPTFDSSYTTSDTINITALASSDPPANGITYDDNGTLPSGVEIDPSTGDITGTPDDVTNAEYNVVITATDSVTYASISTASATVNITVAGSYDANGFSTVTPFDHNVTGTQFDTGKLHRVTRDIYDTAGYDTDGYNSQGLNDADHYDPLYDENVSRS
jgi:hypothetical protein